MPEVTSILYLAYKLSILTFYAGALIYALPIPWRGVKRWAPILVADGVFTLVLLLSVDMLLYGSDLIAHMLGGSWELLDTWISRILGVLLDFKLIIASIKLLPDLAGVADGILYALSPIDKAVNAALFLVAAVAGVAWLVKDLGLLLIAIGLALYAVPFRISRSAGAWLIAFVLVFNTGLQVLPVFISTFANYSGLQDASEPKIGFTIVKPHVTGYRDQPIMHGILRAEYNNNIIIVLPIENGSVRSKLGEAIMLPPTGRVYFSLEVLGVEFKLYPYPVNIEETRTSPILNLYTPRILASKDNGLLVYTTGTPIGFNSSNNGISIISFLDSRQYIEIRAPSGCIESYSSNGTIVKGIIEWKGINVEYLRINPQKPGVYYVSASLSQYCSLGDIRVPTKEWDQGATSILLDFNIFTAFIIYYFTVPLLYYTILFTVTFGLAKLLGGRDRMPVRIA